MSNINSFNHNLSVKEISKLLERQNEYVKTIDFAGILKRSNEQYKLLSKLAAKAVITQDYYLNSLTYKQLKEFSQSLNKFQYNFLNSDTYKQISELSYNLTKFQNNYFNSAAFKQINEFSKNFTISQYNFLNSDSYLNFTKSILSMQKAFKKNKILYDDCINQYKIYISSIANNLESYNVQLNSPTEGLVDTFIKQIENSNLTHNKSLSEPLNNLIDISRAAIASDVPNDENALINKIIQFINYQIINLPSSSDAIRNCINHLFFLFAFIIQFHIGNSSQADLLSMMEDLHAVTFSKLSAIEIKLDSQQLQYNYYLHKKQSVNLINKPSYKNSSNVVIIHPGQNVRIIEKKGEWIKVEFFSFITNQHHAGWQKKKYFKKINRN